MAICRYYQQGTCTFGSSCKFEHSNAGGRGGSVFSGSGGQGGQNSDIVNTLVTTVKQDMDQSTKGKQWIFSCYSPAKDCVSIPGMEDISAEEMRSWAYEDKMSTQYQQKIQNLIADYNKKRQALLNPSNDLKEVLRKIYNKETLTNIPPNIFEPQGSGGGTFGGQSSGGGLFGGQTQNQNQGSIFGGQKSAFGQSTPAVSQSSSSIFGGQNTTTQQSSSIFGGSAGGQSSLFGGQKTANSAFGGQPQNSIFGGVCEMRNVCQANHFQALRVV